MARSRIEGLRRNFGVTAGGRWSAFVILAKRGTAGAFSIRLVEVTRLGHDLDTFPQADSQLAKHAVDPGKQHAAVRRLPCKTAREQNLVEFRVWDKTTGVVVQELHELDDLRRCLDFPSAARQSTFGREDQYARKVVVRHRATVGPVILAMAIVTSGDKLEHHVNSHGVPQNVSRSQRKLAAFILRG